MGRRKRRRGKKAWSNPSKIFPNYSVFTRHALGLGSLGSLGAIMALAEALGEGETKEDDVAETSESSKFERGTFVRCRDDAGGSFEDLCGKVFLVEDVNHNFGRWLVLRGKRGMFAADRFHEASDVRAGDLVGLGSWGTKQDSAVEGKVFRVERVDDGYCTLEDTGWAPIHHDRLRHEGSDAKVFESPFKPGQRRILCVPDPVPSPWVNHGGPYVVNDVYREGLDALRGKTVTLKRRTDTPIFRAWDLVEGTTGWLVLEDWLGPEVATAPPLPFGKAPPEGILIPSDVHRGIVDKLSRQVDVANLIVDKLSRQVDVANLDLARARDRAADLDEERKEAEAKLASVTSQLEGAVTERDKARLERDQWMDKAKTTGFHLQHFDLELARYRQRFESPFHLSTADLEGLPWPPFLAALLPLAVLVVAVGLVTWTQRGLTWALAALRRGASRVLGLPGRALRAALARGSRAKFVTEASAVNGSTAGRGGEIVLIGGRGGSSCGSVTPAIPAAPAPRPGLLRRVARALARGVLGLVGHGPAWFVAGALAMFALALPLADENVRLRGLIQPRSAAPAAAPVTTGSGSVAPVATRGRWL